MKDCGCLEDPVTVDDWCYFHIKIIAGLIGNNRNGHDLTPGQLQFIGAAESKSRPTTRSDPWAELLRGIDTDPVEPWEIKTPRHGYGD